MELDRVAREDRGGKTEPEEDRQCAPREGGGSGGTGKGVVREPADPGGGRVHPAPMPRPALEG